MILLRPTADEDRKTLQMLSIHPIFAIPVSLLTASPFDGRKPSAM
jgi:hypothetical protein